jgi:hypothetical protein
MSLKVLAVALPLLALHTAAIGQELEKRGLPCVAELCLGDGIAELSKIQWAPAQNAFKINNKAEATGSMKLSDDKMRMLKSSYPGAGPEVAPYLHANQFDAAALPGLAKVAAACHSNELIGTYGAGGSTPTRVGISLMPSLSDPSKQAWTVTTIVREFPSAVTNESRADISNQLKAKYSKFGAGNSDMAMAKAGEGRFFPSGMTRFGFGLSLGRGADEESRMSKSAACTSAAADKSKAG